MSLVSIVRTYEPFKHLTDEEMNELIADSEVKSYPPHRYLFYQQENAHPFLYIILSGMVEIDLKTDACRILIVGSRSKGDLFGETGVLAGKPYAASAKTVTGVQLLLLKKEKLSKFMAENAAFTASFSLIIMEHLRELFEVYSHEPGHSRHMEGIETKKASQFMSQPVLTCGADESVDAMRRKMEANRVSALAVLHEDGSLLGIVTEKELLHRGYGGIEGATSLTARSIAKKDPVVVEPHQSYYQILLAMIKKQAKHAIVLAEEEPVGIITYRDLLRLKNLDFLQITELIQNAESIAELEKIPPLIDRALSAWQREKAPVSQILDLVTEFYDQMTGKLIDLILKEMEPQFGIPPLPFCWLTMGSSGRREQFMRTDQDNALLYIKTEDPSLLQEADRFFANLSERVVEGLVRLGFARCLGNVMATNPIWRGSWEDFYARITKWILFPAGENLRNLTIFLDFRPIYGDFALAERLRRGIFQLLSDTPIAYRFLGEDAVKGNLPLGLFGRPIGNRSGPHRDMLDLKGSVSVYLTDSVRLLSLESGIETTHTLERIDGLVKMGILPEDFAQQLKEAFTLFLQLRITLALTEMEKGGVPTSYLPLKSLSRSDQTRLTRALHTLERLVEMIKFKYQIR